MLAGIANRLAQANHVAMRGLRIAAVCIAAAMLASLAIGILQVVGVLPMAGDDWIPLGLVVFIVVTWLAPAIVGLLIALRQPRNVVAWIMLLGAFSLTILLPLDLVLSDGWALQVDRATWPLLYAWPIAVTFVFPNGRLLSRRWRWVAGGAVTCFVGFNTHAILHPAPF